MRDPWHVEIYWHRRDTTGEVRNFQESAFLEERSHLDVALPEYCDAIQKDDISGATIVPLYA
jgi:hypothetical protein